MAPITTWNIYLADGRYLGQSTAFAAQTAFCRLMSVSGTQILESDVEFDAKNDDSGRITYGSQEFVLSPQEVST